jgi:hypothetical protein
MTWFSFFLSSRANETGGDLAVMDGHFFVTDEETDLSGAGVLDVGHEVFAPAKVLLGRQVSLFVGGGTSDCRGEAHGRYHDAARHCGNRRGGPRLLKKHSPAYRFHSSSLGGFLYYSEPTQSWMMKMIE